MGNSAVKELHDGMDGGEASAKRLLLNRLAELETLTGEAADPGPRLDALLEAAYILLDLERLDEAWRPAKNAFDVALAARDWSGAAEACGIISRTDHPDAMKALAHGVWLAVTYPIDPGLTVALLQRLAEEMPAKADGAAVAASAARYVVDLRATGEQRDELRFFTAQLLADIASRHGVESQELFDFWVGRMQLDDPAVVLSRLAKIIDAVAGEGWWFDRDSLRAGLPAE